jgi:ABC-type glycerol-3-phosphate transport system substrate-binding protein
MRVRRRWLLVILALLTATGTLASPVALRAQDNSAVTLTLAVFDFNREAFASKLVSDFEASHPGIKVKLISVDPPDVPRPSDGLDKYLEAVQKYISQADVLIVERDILSPEATRAGYFLDMAPLAKVDSSLNVDDFYPALWQSFAWDQGLWALPTSAQVIAMSYSPSAFDKAGLAYPSDQWTADDLTNAIRKLAQKDAEGKVTVHGIDLFKGFTDLVLIRSLLHEGLYDSSAVPNMPKLDKPEVETLLNTWAELDKDGLIGSDFNKAPISISPVIGGLVIKGQDSDPNSDEKRVWTLLPGGKAGLEVQGYAVSGGTQHPEQAYALAAFLTTRAEASMPGNAPARRSLQSAPAGNVRVMPAVSPEMKELMQKALENGIPMSEMRFTDYVAVAFQKVRQDNLDAKAALQAVEAQAVTNLQAAADKKDKTVLAVATPVPSNLTPGKAALKFGVTSFVQPFPNREGWDRLIQEFTSTDPQIGQIDFNTGFYDMADAAQQFDCFYTPFNAVPSARLSALLNLDPFLSADSTFDPSDVVGNTLAQLTRENKIWGLPIAIMPAVLKYDKDQFQKAGVPAPDKGWTIDAFTDALKALKANTGDEAPFNAISPGGTHLLMLIAAYGGVPLDYRTNPPTIDFTSPAVVTAIRQVLDLAKQGYIKYSALGNVGSAVFIGQRPNAPIYTASLDGLKMIRGGTAEDPYRSVNYPRGSQFTPLSYSIGTAYISSQAQNPEGCYRWISTLARHPELFSAMPARRSLLSDPATSSTRAPDLNAIYQQIDELLKDPNTIPFPSMFDGSGSQAGFLLQHWLYEAFDTYVLHDGDLEAALKDAEGYAKGFQQCTASIPPFDPDVQSQTEYAKQFMQCAAKADQRLKTFVDGFNTSVNGEK